MQQQSEAIGRADSGSPLVCAAAPEQRERVLAVITLAFAADPFVRYWLPDPQVYTRDFPRIAGLFGGAVPAADGRRPDAAGERPRLGASPPGTARTTTRPSQRRCAAPSD